jgi:hypothetical protein
MARQALDAVAHEECHDDPRRPSGWRMPEVTVPRHSPPLAMLTPGERERMRMEGVRIGCVVLWSGCSTIPCQCCAWGEKGERSCGG